MGKIRCPLRPASMTLDRDRPEILTPPEHPQACCTQQTITVPADVNAKTRQKHDYPSAAHRRSYARRTGAERGFATAKDPAAKLKREDLTSAPGRIRTRDPLLRRHISTVAGRRLMSPYEAFSCSDCSWKSPGVAQSLALLAPRLALRNLVAFANVRESENSIDSAGDDGSRLREPITRLVSLAVLP